MNEYNDFLFATHIYFYLEEKGVGVVLHSLKNKDTLKYACDITRKDTIKSRYDVHTACHEIANLIGNHSKVSLSEIKIDNPAEDFFELEVSYDYED